MTDPEFSVLNCLYDTVSIMLRKNVEKRQMMKQLDGIFLAVDEICDRGIILEIEPNDVIDKVGNCKILSNKKSNFFIRSRFETTTYHWRNKRLLKSSNQQRSRSSGHC